MEARESTFPPVTASFLHPGSKGHLFTMAKVSISHGIANGKSPKKDRENPNWKIRRGAGCGGIEGSAVVGAHTQPRQKPLAEMLPGASCMWNSALFSGLFLSGNRGLGLGL